MYEFQSIEFVLISTTPERIYIIQGKMTKEKMEHLLLTDM